MAQAPSGKGKTGAFSIGMVCRCDPNVKAPQSNDGLIAAAVVAGAAGLVAAGAAALLGDDDRRKCDSKKNESGSCVVMLMFQCLLFLLRIKLEVIRRSRKTTSIKKNPEDEDDLLESLRTRETRMSFLLEKEGK